MRRTAAAAVLAQLLAVPIAQAEDFPCVMVPSAEIRLTGAVSGLIEEVLVRRGDTVRAGEVVARLVATLERAAVATLGLRAESTSAVEAQRARLALLETRRTRTERLKNRGVATSGALDEIEAEVEVARQQLVAAETAQQIARHELGRAEASLALREVRSPIDGVVTARVMQPGEYLHAEAHVLEIASLDPLHVDVFLPAEVFGRITVGQTAIVTPAAPISGQRPANVEVVDRVFDAASGTFGVRLKMENPDEDIPGHHRCAVRFSGELNERLSAKPLVKLE